MESKIRIHGVHPRLNRSEQLTRNLPPTGVKEKVWGVLCVLTLDAGDVQVGSELNGWHDASGDMEERNMRLFRLREADYEYALSLLVFCLIVRCFRLY